MKSAFVAALGVAALVTLGASSAARAAMIDFSVVAFDGAVTYTGVSLDASASLDLDQATLLVSEVKPGDSSGLALFDPVTLSALTSPPSSNIIYGTGTGPTPLGADVILSWTAGTDTFTETLTTATSINRGTADEIGLILSGTLSDTGGLFTDSPVVLILTADQAGGPGQTISLSFTNTSSVAPAIPETSTWAMMALGFGALGYAASRRRKARIATLFA
jgi:PEP-CTERM motif